MKLWEYVTQRDAREVACATVDGNDPPVLLQAFVSRSGKELARFVGPDGRTVEAYLSDFEGAIASVKEQLLLFAGPRTAERQLTCTACDGPIFKRATYFKRRAGNFCSPTCDPGQPA